MQICLIISTKIKNVEKDEFHLQSKMFPNPIEQLENRCNEVVFVHSAS